MKLYEVTHDEEHLGSFKFSIGCNRFFLFDRDEEELNPRRLSKISNYLDLEVLETVKADYINYATGDRFPVTHIVLDISDENLNVRFCPILYGEDTIVGNL